MSQSAFQRYYERFWTRFEVSDAKLRLFRFAFYLVFAVDAWLQISHAPRYGDKGFNVSHFPFLDGILPVPGREGMSWVFAVQCFLGARLAVGGASRWLYAALAGLHGYGYWISQLNSYQHHYLLFIALCFLAAFPWPDLRDQEAYEAMPKGRRAELNWMVRMLLVSLSIMYFFAFVSKLGPDWRDGTSMSFQLSEGWIRSSVESMGWGTAAKLVILTELALVFLLHWRRSWPLTIFIGMGMHMAFEFSGLKIGLFSYFMLSIYLLLLPESWIAWVRDRLMPPIERLRDKIDGLDDTMPWGKHTHTAFMLLGLVLAVVVGVTIRIDTAEKIMSAILGIALINAALRKVPSYEGLRLLFAVGVFFYCVHQTDGLRDYYRYWGGNMRRAGDLAGATIAYEEVVAIAPDYADGHRHLGDLYRRQRRLEEALSQYEAGLALEADHFKLNQGAAQTYEALGKPDKAVERARVALKTTPNDKVCLRIVKQYGASQQ